jgi:desampylase
LTDGSQPAGLTVRAAVVEAIVEHARASAPNECCGVLIGRDDITGLTGPTGGRIDEAVPGHNIDERPATRFLLDPRDHLAALKDARRRGLDVVGFYHSHPRSPAEPSPTDRAEATYAGHLFLIVGLAAAPADLRLYRYIEGNFQRVPFVTVP